jgi:hypothetical protein
MPDACIFKSSIMYDIKTIFKVRVHPHPSKRKAITNETVESPGYSHDAAQAVDNMYKATGQRTTKVLAGFSINGRFVQASLKSI